MREISADVFEVAATVEAHARDGTVTVKTSTGEFALSGMMAKRILGSILTDVECEQIDRIHRAHCDKWGGDPWQAKAEE